jgi:hypothetical protein
MNYFASEQINRLKESWELQEHVLAPHVEPLQSVEHVSAGDLVLLSLSEEVGAAVRYKWYGFSQITSTKIIDCGNYVGNDIEPIFDMIIRLWEQGAIVAILSSNMDKGLYHHLHDKMEARIAISTSITRSAVDTNRLYQHISFVTLANQIHRCKPAHLMKSDNQLMLRLGEMRAYFAECEPYIRHADCCFFDLNSIRYADAPGQPQPSTSGLTSEEACHLARYAGQASQMRLFWIHNYYPEFDQRQVTADLMAQMLWYFVDGLEQRKDPMPVETSRLQAYVVEFDRLDIPLTFYKSPVTDRWWVSGSIDLDAKPIPCSIRDYETAKKGELSQRLLELLQVYG